MKEQPTCWQDIFDRWPENEVRFFDDCFLPEIEEVCEVVKSIENSISI
jgi:hypothetical protein